MRVDFIWIENYKSFKKRQKLELLSSIAVIIGKNESGKSNLIDVLGDMSLFNGFSESTYTKTPLDSLELDLNVVVECSFSETEINMLNLSNEDKKVRFSFSKTYEPYKVKFLDGVIKYFEADSFQRHFHFLLEIINDKKSKITTQSNRQTVDSRLEFISNITKYMIPKYKEHFKTIKNNITKLLSNEQKEEYIKSEQFIIEYIEKFYNILPRFYKYNEMKIKNQYNLNKEFYEQKGEDYKFLDKLMRVIGCDMNDLKNACSSSVHQGINQDAREKIEQGVENIIQDGFNEFYKQEENFIVKPNFNTNKFSMLIKTSGTYLNYSERSQGLQWYLNLYINILANNLTEENVVFLFDEPGVYLHVEAQKKLLELFENLTKTKNQIIYTTHSPFMLNEYHLNEIRAIHKNSEGYSKVVNSVLSDKMSGTSKKETLSPLFKALGMKLEHNIGMAPNQLNVITEGYTDAIYLNELAGFLEYKNIKFIPSIGASQMENIISIFLGWGLQYKALFDDDDEGRKEKNRLLKKFFKNPNSEEAIQFSNTHICMVSDAFKSIENYEEDKDYSIESLISEADYIKVNAKFNEEEIVKSDELKKIFCIDLVRKVKSKEITLSDETIRNFKCLFDLFLKDAEFGILETY